METIFGRRHRQPKRNKQRAGRAAVEVSQEVDQREWDTTVFRVRWGNLLLKIYDQSGRVLRVEVVEKRPGTRRYRCRAGKFSALCGYVVVREKVLKPLMAGAAPSLAGPAPKRLSALDQRYLALQVHMKRLFQTLGLNTKPPTN